jgi:hypothetical protein
VGDTVTIQKRYEMKAPAAGTSGALDLSGDATITFDAKDGFPRGVEFKGAYTVTRTNVTVRVPLTVSYKLVEGAERDKVLNPPPPPPPKPIDLTQLLAELQQKAKAQNALGQLARAKLDEARRAEVVKAVEPLLVDENLFVRKGAIEALGTWGTKDNVPSLLPMVEDKDVFVRWEAFKTLGKLKDERAAEPLARRLTVLQDRGFVSQAIQQLGSKAEKAVHPYLKEKDRSVRLTAAQILEKIGTKESKAALEEASKDENIGVASTAKRALQEIAKRP